MKLLLRICWVGLLLLGTRRAYAQTATATLDCSSAVSVFRVGCPYRYTVNLSSLACASASGYAWDACPAEATVTAGGTSGDNFIELTFNRETTGPSKAYGVTIYLADGPNCSRSSSTARAIRYYRADNTPLTANPYTAQTTICQYTPFTLILVNAPNVASCVWQQKDIWSTTWSDVSNGTGSPTNNFVCSIAGLYISTTYRAQLVGCSNNQYTPPSYSSEISITTGAYASAAGVVIGERDVVAGNNQGSLVAANWSGQFKYWQYSLDNGANWTTLPQNTTEELTYENLTATTLYRTVVSQCNQDAYSPSCPIRVHAAADDLSWTETKTFALSGTTLTSDSRTYFDGFSKPLQSQAKSLSTRRVLATQPLYGRYDQAVGSTLAAPIAGTDFAYSPGFVTPASAASAAYDYTRFDNGPQLNAPEVVSSATPNTLGWYYSTNNTTEPYTAITSFPYSRTDAIADGSTGVSRAAGPGVGLQIGSTHEVVQGSFPVRTELDTYATLRNSLLPAAASGNQVTTMQQAAVQQLSTDADGNSALVFADKSGHPVMSARPATGADAWATASNSVEIGWPQSVQVGKSSPLTKLLQFTATADIMAFDNGGRLIITGSPDQVAQQIGSSGNIQNYLFYSTDPFTVINDPGTGGVADVFTSQQREAYPYFNFYLVGDGYASVTNKPTLPGSQYSIINTVTGNPVSLSSSSPLPPGCYQVRIISGAMTLNYSNRYKDISYSFYNQKGQLVESIAPKGVQQLLQSGLATPPTYATTFEYDQQGRQTAMNETDAGRTVFVYRADGKLRFSQNAKQAANNTFSYIGYDAIGRVVEVGEGLVGLSSVYPGYVESISYGGSGLPGYYSRRDIIHTTYDVTDAVASPYGCPSTSYHLDGYTASFLAGRVATVARYSTGSPYSGYTLSSHTWYSYDEQGRTQWQIQQTAGQPARTVDYTYDGASNTAIVCYQKSTPAERLTHYYTYDADNRLSKVQTDTNDPASNPYGWGRTLHADYTYYLTGALRRVAYAYNLQGVDYTYTAAGQLKSINDADLSQDPGQDGNGRYTSPDFWGTSLHYYPNDYTSRAVPNLTTFMSNAQHYNGLVSGISWKTPSSPPNAYGYDYDYKGQLVKATYGTLYNYTGRQYGFSADPNRYQEGNLDYDPNGNIGHLQRTDGMGVPTLAGTYQYKAGTNQLNQILNAGSPAVSYEYDAIGQVATQREPALGGPSGARYLDYDASGKVTALYQDAGHTLTIARYTYDEFGKRLIQQVYPNPQDQSYFVTTTFVRDAAGHELASYVATTSSAVPNPTPVLYEQPIYGATRLGIYRRARDQAPAEQLYELNDQLGNTRIVFRAPVRTTYVLSLEDARMSQEQQDFPEPTATTYTDTRSSEHYYAASPYNAGAGLHYSTKLTGRQGPTKTILAQRGDRIDLSVYAAYLSPAGTVTNSFAPVLLPLSATSRQQAPTVETTKPVTGLARALSNISIGIAIPFGRTTQQTMATQGLPQAALQYVILKADDNSPVPNGTGTVLVDANGQGNWEQLQLSVTITQNYPVKVVISTQNYDGTQPVYFDDLAVNYTAGPIVEENHYYAYGQRNEGLSWRRTDERLYGRGYQGQNTTQDAESGYTAFDLRMYDARYGRWLSTDPARQHFSAYTAFANNPVGSVDIDGGEDSPIFSSLTGNFLGNDSEGFTGKVLFMNDLIYSSLSSNSSGLPINHNVAEQYSTTASGIENYNVIINAYSYVAKLTDGFNSDRLYNGSLSLAESDQSKGGGIHIVNDGDKGVGWAPAYTTRVGNSIKVTLGKLDELRNVEDIQNMFVHEYYGHRILGATGYSTHFKAFDAQIAHPTWQKTSKTFKQDVKDSYDFDIRSQKEIYFKTH